MKKVVIFVEGQTEQIFLNKLLLAWYGYQLISINNTKILSKSNESKSYGNYRSPTAQILFHIINVEGVGSLQKAVIKKYPQLKEDNFGVVLVLRDLLAEDYLRIKTSTNLNPECEIINIFNRAISKFISDTNIKFHFAKMEIEAWMFAFIDRVEKYFNLSEDAKTKNHVFDIETINLEEIENPKNLLKQFSDIAGYGAHTSVSELERFWQTLSKEEITEVMFKSRVPKFNVFWQDLVGI
jgi:hypothetical protein